MVPVQAPEHCCVFAGPLVDATPAFLRVWASTWNCPEISEMSASKTKKRVNRVEYIFFGIYLLVLSTIQRENDVLKISKSGLNDRFSWHDMTNNYYAFTASMILIGPFVGMIRVILKPAERRRVSNSSAVLSTPPGSSSISRSMILPRSGVFGPLRTASMIRSFEFASMLA